MTLGAMVRKRRNELGLTLEELATRVGCTKGYLSTVENERRDGVPSESLLSRLEWALRLEGGQLCDAGRWKSTPQPVRERVRAMEQDNQAAKQLAKLLRTEGIDTLHGSGTLKALVDHLAPPDTDEGGAQAFASALPMRVPLVNKVAAGYPTEFTDLGYPARVADEYVSVPDVYDTDAFAARVVGDSMEPQYREGDVVVFSPAAPTRDGTDCFVRLERDAETTFKRVYFSIDDDGREHIRLQPLNSAYEARSFAREDVAGLYAATYVVRAIGVA